ncbi:MAG: dtdp-4-dehydrorhamnose reductase [Betaproteobacteria bacterium]|nr:dtdp-4-dehydrorhamnose reductase [Betaproteobacteria bacterium]
MRIYVAGCGGMLGEAVRRVFGAAADELKCTDIDINAPWLEHCDFRDLNGYRESVESFAPDVLVHLGAHTDLEYCERNPDDAYRTNTLSVEHAAKIALDNDLPLVYVSTAGIFDGTKARYDERDLPNPLGVYGRSKYRGEQIVEAGVLRHLICRAGWMMGGGPQKDKKFIGKLMRQLAAGTTTLHVVNDKLGTPTYTVDFARNLRALLAAGHFGLYNMVCAGETSRLEVAGALIDILGLQDKVEIKAVDSGFFAREYFAPRPASERLLNRKLDQINLNLMRDWRIALAEYIADYFPPAAKVFPLRGRRSADQSLV